MRFRFTLTHEILGSLEISEPIGWTDAKLKLERDEEFHSMVEYFDGDFVFYGDNGEYNGGIDFIRQVEREYGHDAELEIRIEIAPDDINFEDVFTGQLDLANLEEMPDNKMEVPIIRNDFWAKFINRKDTEVDLQSDTGVDGTDVSVFDSMNLRLLSQKVQYTSKFFNTERYSISDSDINAGDYIQIDFDTADLDEIREKFSYPIASNPEIPFEILTPEFEGDYTFDIQVIFTAKADYLGLGVTFGLTHSSPAPGRPTIEVYIQVNDDAPIAFSHSDYMALGAAATKYNYNGTLSLRAGDFVRVYGQLDTANTPAGSYILLGKNLVGINALTNPAFDQMNEALSADSHFNVVAQTTFPETYAPGFFLHDAFAAVIERITGQPNSFYSEFLGSSQTIARQYDADGCGWAYALFKGLQLRRYSLEEKPFFTSFKKLWDGANPILNLGLGYETIDGVEVIRIEPKEYFYDKSQVSVNLSNIRDIVRKYDDSRLFKTIRIGYKKWQSEDVSGIDDPQTKHTYATILKRSGRELTLESDFIAASLAIETTRRKTREKSADYKFDNDTFIIAVNPFAISISPETSPDVTDYDPELDENYESVTNLLNPDTRYNLPLTPAQNFLRWNDWLSAGLQAYIDSGYKFSGGEGNYDMTSNLINVSDGCTKDRSELSEKQDLPISNDPYHLALLYPITCPLDWEDYKAIRENSKYAIGISQTDSGHVKFLAKELEYGLLKGELKAEKWATEFMEIAVIETGAQMRLCEAAEEALCVDAITDEFGNDLVDTNGECITI